MPSTNMPRINHRPRSAPPIASSSNEQRPEWLDKPAEFSPDGTYTVVVRTNPYLRMQDARREIESKMRQEAREFVEMITRRRMSSRSHSRLPWDYISSKAKVADYQEITHSTGAGANMFVVHTQLKFTPKLQGEIEWIVEQSQVSQRTGFLVMIAGLVLALIGVVYAYLRLDTATKGYYTWRLRFLAVMIAAGAFGTVCVVIDEYNLDDAFDTVYWHPVAQARSERLR